MRYSVAMENEMLTESTPNGRLDFEAEIEESLDAMKAFKRGENTLVVHTYNLEIAPVATIRQRLNLSQMEFAGMLGVSVRAVQDWEEGRRKPQGPAKMLLRIA